jgi:hypothetical protein
MHLRRAYSHALGTAQALAARGIILSKQPLNETLTGKIGAGWKQSRPNIVKNGLIGLPAHI